jgi:hypothetical protein
VPLRPFIDVLDEQLMEIRGRIAELLTGSRLILRHLSGDGIVFIGPEHYWEPLPPDLRVLQRVLREDAARWFQVVATLGLDVPSVASKISACEAQVMAVIDQDEARWSGDINKIAGQLWKDLTDLVKSLREVHSSDAVGMLISDTNALLHNPALEEWRFAEVQPFQLVIVPVVLSELDELKEGRSGQSRTEKASRIIRQIKEYARRGTATRGVPLVSGVSTFRMVAAEPRMDRTLPWLDRHVNDDRLLASFLEIVRQDLNAPAALVTRDVNLQNKAAMIGVPWLEPPDPLE